MRAIYSEIQRDTVIDYLLSKAGYLSMNEVYNLRRDYEDTRIPYKLQHVGVDSPELEFLQIVHKKLKFFECGNSRKIDVDKFMNFL